MVEGDDPTDRSSACGGSSDYRRQPDSPEELHRNQGKEPAATGAELLRARGSTADCDRQKADSKSDLSSEIPNRLSWLVRKLLSILRRRGAPKPWLLPLLRFQRQDDGSYHFSLLSKSE
jgi:hypothetical protein